MNRGYIKLFRKIEDNILWRSNEPYCKRAAWVDLILLANHKDNDFLMGNKKIVVKRGQHWTSNEKLQQRWRWSEKRVREFLKLLQEEGMIWEISRFYTQVGRANCGAKEGAKDEQRAS